jgi:hypothetical protein
MYNAAFGIEERCVRNSGQRPLATHFSADRFERHEGAAAAGDVEPIRSVIDVNPVCARRWKLPVLNLVEFGHPSNQDHRGLLDCEEHSRARAVDHAPSWSPGKIDCPSLVSFEI